MEHLHFGNAMSILANFYPRMVEKTTKEIEEECGISHETAFRILKSLTQERCLRKKVIGGTNVYSYRHQSEDFLIYCAHMTRRIQRAREGKQSLLFTRLSEYAKLAQAQCIILFGSYAKGTQTKTSDIDILAVTATKNAEQVAKTFRTMYNLDLHVMTVRPHDVKRFLGERYHRSIDRMA